MPELPEVEIARRNLERWARGHLIVEAHAAACRVFRDTSAAGFSRRVKGHRIEAVTRRGKYLLVVLDGGEGILVHLGMTGRLLRRRAGTDTPPRTRATLHLDDGQHVHYVSTRLLGRLVAAPVDALEARDDWASLGPDPLADRFTVRTLREALRGSSRPVKPALMDQGRLAGLGNIQAAEALWLARIDPRTPAGHLDDEALRRLRRGILRTLRDTIAEIDGDEVSYLTDGDGVQNLFRVYDRAGARCPRCRGRIRTLPQGGRTTFYCPRCQKA